MGRDRNLSVVRFIANVQNVEKQNFKDVNFSDPGVCKWYICSFCPSELFTNTKSDLGPCNKLHDDYCREA